MKKIIYFIIPFIFCFCSKQKDEISNKKATETPLKPIHGLFSNYGIMFVKMDNNMIASTNANHLERFYNGYFSDKYPTFETFISDALEQKIVFEIDKFNGRNIVVFALDKNVENEFKNSGISYLLNKYCEKIKSGYTFKNLILSDDKSFSIMYYLFMDGSRISFDDVGGFYTIKI